MDFPRMFIEILWLIFTWIIWLLLKWRNWPRPSMSVMLIYSTAVVIFDIRYWQGINTALKVELVDTSFSLLRLLAGVSFWFVLLYVPVALTLKPKSIFDQRKYWWIALLILSLSVWHIVSPESLSLISDFIYFDLIITKIFLYTLLMIFVPWIIWWFIGKIEQPWPSLPIMLLYSISATIVSARFWDETFACKLVRYACKVDFSLPLFLAEIALWFLPLYALLKLVLKVESGNKPVELAEKHNGQPIGIE